MGKVYEALQRVDNASDPAGKLLKGAPAPDEEEVERSRDGFNFLRYSLGAPSMFESERQRRETSAVLAQRSEALAAREVTLDPGRVDSHLVSFYNIDPQATNQYNNLALSLITKAAERRLKRVLIASPNPSDGRTTVTLNLACALARARQRVLVIDCDLAGPSTLRALGIDSDTGIAEVATLGISPREVTIKVLPYGFNLLPACGPVEMSAALFTAAGFKRLLQMFSEDYDFILFDSSPLLVSTDASLLARLTDTTLLVIRAGTTSTSQMARAVAPFTQEDIFGAVINRAV